MHNATPALVALFVATLACGGCTHHVIDNEKKAGAGAASTSAKTSWLAGDWSLREEGRFDVKSESYDLKPDGTGTYMRSTIQTTSEYLPDSHTEEPLRWSSDGETLWINKTAYPIVASANCQILQLGSRTFSRNAPATCPFEMPELSELETLALGDWNYDSPSKTTSMELVLDANRHAWFSYYRTGAWNEDREYISMHVYYEIDSKKVLHGTDARGDEILRLQLGRQ